MKKGKSFTKVRSCQQLRIIVIKEQTEATRTGRRFWLKDEDEQTNVR